MWVLFLLKVLKVKLAGRLSGCEFVYSFLKVGDGCYVEGHVDCFVVDCFVGSWVGCTSLLGLVRGV